MISENRMKLFDKSTIRILLSGWILLVVSSAGMTMPYLYIVVVGGAYQGDIRYISVCMCLGLLGVIQMSRFIFAYFDAAKKDRNNLVTAVSGIQVRVDPNSPPVKPYRNTPEKVKVVEYTRPGEGESSIQVYRLYRDEWLFHLDRVSVSMWISHHSLSEDDKELSSTADGLIKLGRAINRSDAFISDIQPFKKRLIQLLKILRDYKVMLFREDLTKTEMLDDINIFIIVVVLQTIHEMSVSNTTPYMDYIERQIQRISEKNPRSPGDCVPFIMDLQAMSRHAISCLRKLPAQPGQWPATIKEEQELLD